MTNITKLPEVHRKVRSVITDYKEHEFPFEIGFNEGMEHPCFKITIEKQDSDTYIDSNGQKWKKVK